MITIDEELIWESYLNVDDETRRDRESKDTTGYGCLMVFFDEESAEDIKEWSRINIPPEIQAEDGIEDEPHITCQYGFHPDVSIEEITDFVNTIENTPIEVELGDITMFENQEYDVIKIDVFSDDLQELSKKIRKDFDGRLEVTFPDYHPHVTLGYVKKGEMPHIEDNNMFKGKNYVFKDFVYSTAGMGEKFDITDK